MSALRKIVDHFNVSIESLLYEKDTTELRVFIEGDAKGKYLVEVKKL